MKKTILIIVSLSAILFLAVSCGNVDNIEIYEPEHIPHDPIVLESGDLSIHFLELGNRYVGDCVYINYNDIDIIIDAGSKPDSAKAIKEYINDYIQDGKIEYVIATHAHQDHIAGFNSSGSGVNRITGILEAYEIGTIIDFPTTNSATVTYNTYKNTRDALVEKGTTHYTALQCYNYLGGAQREFDLGGGITLEILYNYYYENYSSNENNYSVCVKIKQGGNQYIFTGDLEKTAEDKMVEFYEEWGGLGHCVLYKGGHHGSSTSSNVNLMKAISPDYICICTCAGTTEYDFAKPENSFPSQDVINRIAIYTDNVYVTTEMINYAANNYQPLNGDIIFLVSEGDISIICSYDNRKLKDTEWFLNNRTMPDVWK